MIDEPLQQPQTPPRKPRQLPISLLAVVLFLGALILVIMQALRRCGDAVGGQLQWGDLRPLALPGGLFFIGLVLLGFRAILISRRTQSEIKNRHYGLLSLGLLPIFFSIIFTCSQFALLAYPPCSLEIAINPMATADYGAWPYTVFQKVDPRMGTEVALDSFYTPFIPVTVNPVVANFDGPKDPTQIAILTAAAATFAVPTAGGDNGNNGNNTLAPADATQAAVDAATMTSISDATQTAAATLTITTTPTPDLSATPTVTGTLSETPPATITGTLTATVTGTLSATPAVSATPSVTGTLSETPPAMSTGTLTATITGTVSATPGSASTATALVATQTVGAALTSTAAGTMTALVTTATATPSPTQVPTLTPVIIPTLTPFPTAYVPPTIPYVPIPTAMPTFTPRPTRTPVYTKTPTLTPSLTFTPITYTPTITDTPTDTLTPTDTDTPTNTPTPTANSTPFGLGSIYREYWLGLSSSTAVAALTSSPNYPNSPNGCDLRPNFDAPQNWADNYGTRMRGYIYPPTSGAYTFWIASDDNGELWLSTDMNPANRALIATVPGYSNPNEWTKYPAQQSAPITLAAGQGYYIDALQKEGGGLDNLSVAWQGPSIPQAVIPGAYLAPYATTCTFIPTATSTPTPTRTPTFTPSPTNTPTPTPTPTSTNTPVPSANLFMAMSVSNPNPNVGDTIQYNITYGNLGPDTATSVQLVSPLPTEVSYVSSTGGTYDSSTGIWTLGNLINGQNGNLSITVVVSPAGSGMTIPNAASISSGVGDPDGSNNNANTSISVP
ncbi:MAG: PA14 domain-containing protein [Chloroflexota bacterium]